MNEREKIKEAFLGFNNQNPNAILCAQDYFEAGYKAALASQAQQQTQEPVAWMNPYGGLLHVRETGLEKATFTIPLYLQSQAQQEPKESEKAWCEWIATMIGAYLSEPVDSDKCKAIAGIIERRLWGFPKAKEQPQQEPIGEVQHYATPANLPAYVNVKWYGKPPKDGAKVYALPPAPEGE